MTKKEKSGVAVYGIIFVLFNVIYLGIPFPKTNVSWISYVFTLLAIVISFLITAYAFKRGDTIKSKLYGFPIVRVGYLYAGAQLLFCFLISLIAVVTDVASWIPIITSVVLLGVAIIGVIVTDNAKDIVEHIEDQITVNTKVMTYFRLDMDSIVYSCQDSELKKKLERLAEDIRYSDPVSNDELKEIENQISEELKVLKNLIQVSDVEKATEKIKQIMDLLRERNYKCKAFKKD